jgi:putative heme transporter
VEGSDAKPDADEATPGASEATPGASDASEATPEASEAKPAKRGIKRYVLAAGGVAVIVATFAFILPQVANYADVWDVITTLSWPWILALAAATVLNIVTFAPPWMVALPGLGFRSALAVTQASTALANVVPGGIAVGMAGSYAMLAGWGFGATEIGRAVTLTGLWNQFANLLYPIVALFLLTASGESTPLLATAAFIGVAILGVVLGGFVLVLASDRTAIAIGDIAARIANAVLRRFRRGPVDWNGQNFDRFRVSAADLLKRRWHMLTFWALFGSLTVFLLLLVSLRALDVSAAQVSLAEAFAAWALIRIIGTIPITPGGIGVVELGLTASLISFGGNETRVVAAVLVFRFLSLVPTLILGLIYALTWRHHRPASLQASEGADA